MWLKTEKKETENMERGIESTDNDVYEETIGGLEDNELFAMIDTNAPLPVLLVTSQVFVDSTGKQASKSMTFLIVLISVIISILSAPNDIFLLHLVICSIFYQIFKYAGHLQYRR